MMAFAVYNSYWPGYDHALQLLASPKAQTQAAAAGYLQSPHCSVHLIMHALFKRMQNA